jgi:hypothetical protein
MSARDAHKGLRRANWCSRHFGLLLLIAVSTPLAVGSEALVAARSPAPSAGRPILLPGDRWTLRWTERHTELDGSELAGKTTTGSYSQTVVGRILFRGQPAYLLRRNDGTYDVWRLDLWELGRLYPNREIGAVFRLRAASPFPLYVGRTFWRDWVNTLAGYRGRFSYRVSRVEMLQTPAGRLRGFRVDENGTVTYTKGRSRESGYSYYAPAAKRFVVQHIETTSGYRFHVEVVRYSVRHRR